jgi:serine O-acetyltransferase
MKVLADIIADTVSITRHFSGKKPRAIETIVTIFHDGSLTLTLSRLAQAARQTRLPLAGGFLRRLQTTLFGIEIARDVTLGEGVVFLHTIGIVIGGDSHIGDRVVFLGGNTVGSIDTSHRFPRIGNDVVIGAGARILGPVTIGDGASIGANAVVLRDVPPGAVAVGVPAVVRQRRDPSTPTG